MSDNMIKAFLIRKKEVSFLMLLVYVLGAELVGFTVCFFFHEMGLLDERTIDIEEQAPPRFQNQRLAKLSQFDDWVLGLLVETQFRVKELEEENKSISAKLEKQNKSTNANLEEQNKSIGLSLLNVLQTNAMVSYTLLEPSSPEYPLVNELSSITCHIVRDENDTRPVHADIFMSAKSRDAALKIQYACQETIEQVYRDASQLGPIPYELVDAFTVELNDNEITIHIALPDKMAKYLFIQYFYALQRNESSAEQQTSGSKPEQTLINDIPLITPTLEPSTSSESAYHGGEKFQPTIGDYFAGDTSKLESEYFDWLSAATDGNEWAQCRMGDYCFTHNDCEALKWWLLSAEQGNIIAKYKLIKCYYLTSFEEWCKSHSFLHGLFF